MRRFTAYFFVFISCIIANSCSDPITGNIENQPPNTYLSLRPDSVIAPGSTIKRINWWGDDPDGFISGYRISFDSINWGFTNKNDSTFILSITGSDSTFRFFVAAVDNKGLIDPTPATNLYPVVNTPPVVNFDAGTEIPDTTFPLATFKWTGSDADGDENLAYYHWSLNDTNNFRRVPSTVNLLTLTQDSGLVLNADNILYLRVEDDAGAFSPIVQMPDTGRIWHVKAQTARILLIKDMPLIEFVQAENYFVNAMDTLSYDVLDIKSNGGNLIPKIVNPMFIETLRLFDIVIWSANRGNLASDNANFDLAQNSLPFYLQSGGKLFFTTGLPNAEVQGQGDLINFAPIDSLSTCTIALIPSGTSLINEDTGYPVLTSSSLLQRIRGINITPPAQIVYRLPISTACQTNTVIAIKDAANSPRNILMTMPVYQLNGNPNASKELFRKIILNEFNYR
ncbi:MAG: hypothetical protein IPM96_19955 [Ignavibacteria bacterium]|nr:hypothetical protein [Ignavibacteria bacterium]